MRNILWHIYRWSLIALLLAWMWLEETLGLSISEEEAMRIHDDLDL